MARCIARYFGLGLGDIPGEAADPLEDRPVFSSDEDDAGELEVGTPLVPVPPAFALAEAEEEEESEDEYLPRFPQDFYPPGCQDASLEEEDSEDEYLPRFPQDFYPPGWQDASLEEEDSEDEYLPRFPQDFYPPGWQDASPAQAVEPEARPLTPAPQQPTESPSLEEPCTTAVSSSPSAPPALDCVPLGRCKRHRNEDEEEDVSSKRPRLSSPEDSTDEPGPSTSAGTSFRRHLHYHHLLQDSESDED